jgi:VWFA-related protein
MFDAHPRNMSVNVNLVLVPVKVTDALHRPVLDLPQKSFEVFEGNDKQQIRYFYQEDSPISVALVLDTSGSMGKRIEVLREAVNQFFFNANPKDDYTVITVSDRPEILVRGSSSIDDIQATLATVKPAGWTALLDSVRLAAMSLQHAKYQRRVVLVVSDGLDNSSRWNLKKTAAYIEEADVDLYAIGVMDEVTPFFGFLEEKINKKLLNKLSDVTGGRTVVAENTSSLPDLAAQISQEMRSTYVLGYRPTDGAHDKRWKKIEVKVTHPGEPLRLSYKKSYFTPGD